MTEYKQFLPIGEGINLASKNALLWNVSTRRRAWRLLDTDDLYELLGAPDAPYIIREWRSGDVVAPYARHWVGGPNPFIVVFRSGHQLACIPAYKFADPGMWRDLDVAVAQAERWLRLTPALAADATRTTSRRRYYGWWCPRGGELRHVSPLASGFVYVAAKGGMTLHHWGARICEDFWAVEMTPLAKATVAAFQRLIHKQRGIDPDLFEECPIARL